MNIKLAEAIGYIMDAQFNLENMPCGGVGANGATQEEINKANEAGMPIEDEASYHQAQQAWLELEKALTLLRTIHLMDR